MTQHKRKVTKEGRVNIPVEILQQFNINIEDHVDVSTTDSAIVIKKHVDKNYCVVMNKVYPNKELHQVGDVFISNEGLALIKDFL